VSSHEVALGILDKVRLAKYFDLVVTSAESGIRKPDPGIFRYALYQLNIRPEEAIMVGDSERHDIQGGYIAGLRTVLVNRRKRLNESLADYRFKTLADATPRLEALARPTATSQHAKQQRQCEPGKHLTLRERSDA